MRIFKVRVISGQDKKVKSGVPSSEIPTIGVSSERYIDYTNFKDGYVMTFDEERNRYYFENPDNILNKSFEEIPYPEIFTNTLSDEVEKTIDIDMGEY
ncbi:hypothetical protein b3_0328 [Synechococcus phage B3]|jgi:hypothetical protein|nr:hypothetical protein b3_0328 [Synechococcus phage B3]QGT54934.1 hypothetical protein b23_0321 [Synechococcus phage B23]